MKKTLSILAFVVALSVSIIGCTEEEVTPQGETQDPVHVNPREPGSQF